MGVRLEPQDEYMHGLGPASSFNESMYINLYDPKQDVGGWFRCGNRANEDYAEMTASLYLPGGREAFMYKRPEISDNEAFDAGDIRLDMIEPFKRLDVTYTGKVVILDEPLQMTDPKTAFTNNPYAGGEVRIEYSGVSAMFGGKPDETHEKPGEEFAKGHSEQPIAGKGSIRVGDEEWEVDGFGLRDHSWGPRYWQAPVYYRCLTASSGPTSAFMGSLIARRDDEDTYHQAISATLRSKDKEWNVRGKVLKLIPLRNRRHDPDPGDMLVNRMDPR